MTEFQYEILDVFTDTRFKGNGLAIVKDADTLTSKQMQVIAREFNLSETIFILSPDNDAHSAKVRIFTPGSELPFAGHPTVGAAVMLACERFQSASKEEDAIIVLEEGIGPVRVGVRLRRNEAAFAEIDLPRMPEEMDGALSLEVASLVLGLTNAEIGFENHHPSHFSAGNPFNFIPVANLATMERVRVDTNAMEKMLGSGDRNLYVYCRETEKNGNAFHARCFAPLDGIPEDPATGSAAAAFSGVVMKYDQPAGGTNNYIIEQGYEMGRASQIYMELVVGNGLRAVRIGGHAIKVAEGKITV